MGGPIILGAAVLIIFLLTGSLSLGGEIAPGKDDGPYPPSPPPGPQPSVGPYKAAIAPGPNAPGPNDGPAIIPGTKTPVSEVEPRSNADLDAKRQLIAVAFRNAIAGRRKKFPKETEQAAINATAAYFKKRQVHIDAINVNAIPTYYKQPKEKMAAHLAEVVNTYIRGLQAPVVKQAPVAKPPGPSVTTKPDNQKVAIVRKAYSDAIVYLIDSAKQRKGSTIAPQQAVVPVSQYFSGYGVPAPDALTQANQFWTRSVADITSRTSQALSYTKQQVDIQTGVAPKPVARISDLRA